MIHRATVLLSELKAMRLLAGQDETRFVLCGVRVELSKERTLLIATDGRRLGALACSITPGADIEPAKFTIPSDLIDWLPNTRPDDGCSECGYGSGPQDEKVAVAHDADAGLVSLGIGDVVVSAPCIKGEFPDFRNKAIPAKGHLAVASICLNPEFMADLGRVGSILRRDNYGSLSLRFAEVNSKYDGISTVMEVWLGGVPGFYGLLMPMKWETGDGKIERPAWLQPIEGATK